MILDTSKDDKSALKDVAFQNISTIRITELVSRIGILVRLEAPLNIPYILVTELVSNSGIVFIQELTNINAIFSTELVSNKGIVFNQDSQENI